MLNLIILIVTLFFLLSFLITRDILSPSCTICLSYIIAGMSASIISYISDFDYSLSGKTVYIVILGISIFVLVSNVIHLFIYRGKSSFHNEYYLDGPLYLKKNYILVLLFFQLTTLVLYVYYFYKGVGGFSFASFTTVMSQFRAESYFDASMEYIPFVVNQMVKISMAITYVAIYILIYNQIYFKKNKQKANLDIWCIISVFLYIPTCILSGGRYYIIMIFLSGIFIWNTIYLLIYKKRIQFRTILKLTIVIVLLLAFFSATRTLVGRQSKTGFLEYVTSYMGYSIKSLDVFLASSQRNNTGIWGKEVFYGLNRILFKLDLVEPYKVYADFLYYHGKSLGNVYTAFRSQYFDFGMIGIIVLQSIEAIILTVWYEKILWKKNRKLNISLIIYSDLIVTVLMHSYSETFYSELVSLGFPVLVFSLLLIRFVGNLSYIGGGKFRRRKEL